MNASVLYVYGVVRDGFDVSRAPVGLDDAVVSVARSRESGGKNAALVSRLPAAEYAPDVIERNSGEIGWLSPRALAHDRVLTWAQDHGGVIPLPMFSMWESDNTLARSLDVEAAQLQDAFTRVEDADEYGLRVHRRDAAMLDAIDAIDPAMAQLRREAAAASPGQRYLLERKLADQSRSAVRAASHRMATEIHDALKRVARHAISLPLTPGAGTTADATLVLNAAFLVDRQQLDAFRETVAVQVKTYESRGLAFDFTGPWPPYNFVGEAGGAAMKADDAR